MTSSWTRCCSSANRRHLFVWKQQDEISHDNSITAAYRHLNTIKSSGLSGNEFRPAVPIHLLYPMPSLPPTHPLLLRISRHSSAPLNGRNMQSISARIRVALRQSASFIRFNCTRILTLLTVNAQT